MSIVFLSFQLEYHKVMSSANSACSQWSLSEMSEINNVKSSGEMPEPWGTPIPKVVYSVVAGLTRYRRSVMNDDSQISILPRSPRWWSLKRNLFGQTLSKTRLKSSARQRVLWFFVKPAWTACVRRSGGCNVEWCKRKAAWEAGICFSLSAQWYSRFWTMASETLALSRVRLTGL